MLEISVKEAAKLTGYSRYWLRRLCQDGKITARHTVGGMRPRWLINKASLLAYCKRHER